MHVRKWRKSSFSGGDGGDCVEVAYDAVRDSKNRSGPVLRLDRSAFISLVKSGHFER